MSQNKNTSKKNQIRSSTRQRPTIFIHDGRLNYQTYGRYPSQHAQAHQKNRLNSKLIISLIVLLLVIVAYFHFRSPSVQTGFHNYSSSTQPASTQPSVLPTQTQKSSTKTAATVCSSNTIPKFIVVSISARHMWACQGPSQVYDSAVVTGMTKYVSDTTPLGTYKIYAKETNTYLKGSDASGSWNDFVYYWMPFLQNQYGSYGFHDATWRPANAFGNINPDSDQASHGCVEMPLTAAAWLYSWTEIGTTVTINN